MRTPATPSVDQLLVLLAVAEAGSFTAAAKRLGRATSAVSYAIDTLEDQLGLTLFDRGTTRKPKFTPQGEAIVSEARAIAQSIDVLRARVKGLREELEPDVSLVVDSLYPGQRLVTLLREFHAAFPTVPVRLFVQPMGGVGRMLRSGVACIGVGNALHMDMTGFRHIDIPAVKVIPVAAPDYPLAARATSGGPNPRDFVHLVLSEQPHGDGRDYGVIGLNTWRVGDLAAKRELLLGGLGWGGMPEPMVRADIAEGRLVKLDLREWRGGDYVMQAIHRTDTPPGRAGHWLIERLAALSDAPDNAPAGDGRSSRPQKKPRARSKSRTSVA
jgi:DNA-binding transcriptional LysR family regulator